MSNLALLREERTLNINNMAIIFCVYNLSVQKFFYSKSMALEKNSTFPTFMQLTGQNNGGTASSAFLLGQKCN